MVREALTSFGRESATLERAFGPGEITKTPDGWCKIAWPQTWFGESVVATYAFDPSDHLIRIDYSTPDASPTIAAIRAELGAPTTAGPSPQFMNSSAFARWERDRFIVTLEDYAPGCEVGLLARQRLPLA
jgi:hypothetical protein